MKASLLFISLIIGISLGIQFDLPHGSLKCFKENYKKGQAVHGEAHGIEADPVGLNFYVESPRKVIIFRNDMMVGRYSFTADETGSFNFCFMDHASQFRKGDLTRRVEFTSTLVSDEESDTKIKDQDIKPIEKKVQKLKNLALNVESEAWTYQKSEETHRELSDSLNFRASWLSILTIVTVLGLAFSQVFYLQKYLKKTKYID